MELVALRTFQTVVEEGGVLAASRKLNTVQSNVTGRIRRLEEELGVELFFRKGRGLELALFRFTIFLVVVFLLLSIISARP